MHSFRLLLVDDHALFREGLGLVLRQNFPDVEIIDALSVAQAANLGMPAPDVILLDIQLQGPDGIEGLAIFRQRWPKVPVIMLSSMAAPETIALALKRGARAFVSKAESGAVIVAAVERALAGDGSGHDAAGDAFGRDPAAAALIRMTPRQNEVLQLLCEGLPNKVIARRLELSEFTVRGHVQSIFGVLDVASRSQAIVAARRHGLIA